MTKAQSKESVRAIIAARLSAMEESVRLTHSKVVCERLVEELARCNAKRVMFYLARAPELDLDAAIRNALDLGLSVAVPLVAPDSEDMDPVHLASLDTSGMSVDRFGIRAPASPTLIDPSTLDVIVVPGVAFDRSGQRLGRGAGFYDRFLKRLKTRPICIGTCFEEQVIERLPTEPHDEPMDMLVSEHATSHHVV